MQPKSPKLLEDIRLVDHALVWSVIEHQVPALLKDVDALLSTRK